MSRCFPFPPPGYEKEAKPDEANLLKEEKHREKKRKKEKDKEKREGKEKKEKDRSESKHKEKKDKKEKHKGKKDKHRDRKKDKDKEQDKDKDKNRVKGSVSEEKVSVQPDSYNGENLYHKEDRSKDRSSSSDEKKADVHVQGHNGSKPVQNIFSVELEASKFVQELGRRIRDDEKGAASQLVGRSTGTERKRDEPVDKFTIGNAGMLVECLEKSKEKRVDVRKMQGPGLGDEAKFSRNGRVQNSAGVQHNAEGLPSRPMEKIIDRKLEGKEKFKEKGDDKKGDKLKDKDRENKGYGKDKDREKEREKEEKVKKKSQHEKTEQDKFKDTNKNNLIGFDNNKVLHLSKDVDKNASAAAVEGNLNRRKEIGTNGFLHDDDVRPTKMPRPASHPSTENGRKLEPFQTPSPFSSDRLVATNNHRLDKGLKINGIIGVPPLCVSTTKPLRTSPHVDQVAEPPKKLPHPDTKYLSQVLSVPNIEVWSDFDDQEWLFSSKDPPLKRPVMGSTGIDGKPQVWAEAVQIESADICALPYVIPY